MNKKICYALMASVMLSACGGKDAYDQCPAEKEKVSLEVVMSSSETTKISGAGADEEKAVNDYQVLVYDMSSRMLEVCERPDPEADNVMLQCTTGPKEVIVLANAPDVSSVVSYDAFLEKRSLLADNGVGRLVMEGHASLELTAAGSSVTVNIRRIVSKVVLDGITVDFEQNAYDNMDFILKKVYLTNVAADQGYLSLTADPTQWDNKIVWASAPAVDAMVYDTVGDVNLKGGYSAVHHFYCYPNPYQEDTFSAAVWSPRPTRLVIEAELGGVLYYYPVSLPVLEQNTRYHVSLHIVRPGATSPEQDMDKYAATFKINVEEWEGPENVTETI